jgi:hypothetical protein
MVRYGAALVERMRQDVFTLTTKPSRPTILLMPIHRGLVQGQLRLRMVYRSR